jgi:hypothetical protein
MHNVKKTTLLYLILLFFFSSFISASSLSINSNSRTVRLGELLALEVEASEDTSIRWMIGEEVKSVKKRFYFTPTKEGIYQIKVFNGEVEEDTITIRVSSFPTPQCGNTTIVATGNDGEVKETRCNIQEALDFLQLHNGGVAHLSAGIYPINQQLIIYDNITIEGTMDGEDTRSTIRLENDVQWSDRGRGGDWVAVPPLIINDANIEKGQSLLRQHLSSSNHNITIKNIQINANRENQLRKWHSGEGHYIVISFKDVKDVNISNVTLYNGLSDGIFIKTGENISINNSKIKDMGHSAIYQVEVHHAVVENNKIDVHVNSGIRFFGGTDFTIRDNTIFSSSHYGNYGIQISQAYSANIPMKNVLIENNIITQIPYAGIALYASKEGDIAEAIIKNNIIVGCGSKAPNLSEFPNTTTEESGGINIQSFKDVTIVNNTLFNNYGSGIWIDNRFYNSDVDFSGLERILKKVTIKSNIIARSNSEKKEAYGVEKYLSTSSSGTTLNIFNNIFYKNQNGSYSSNIKLNRDNFFNKSPNFMDEIEFDLRLKSNSIALDEAGNVTIGASKEMLERYKNLSL